MDQSSAAVAYHHHYGEQVQHVGRLLGRLDFWSPPLVAPLPNLRFLFGIFLLTYRTCLGDLRVAGSTIAGSTTLTGSTSCTSISTGLTLHAPPCQDLVGAEN
jgi:hypothetical protein